MDKYEITKDIINEMSEKLQEEYKNIKWNLPYSIGKDDVITRGVELHTQIQLMYRLIHEIQSKTKD